MLPHESITAFAATPTDAALTFAPQINHHAARLKAFHLMRLFTLLKYGYGVNLYSTNIPQCVEVVPQQT